jgi:hypothetical protein
LQSRFLDKLACIPVGLNFNEKNPMFVECGPGRLAALLGCRKDSWIPSGFFLITGVSDVELFRKGNWGICGIGIGFARRVEKGVCLGLVFAFLEVKR